MFCSPKPVLAVKEDTIPNLLGKQKQTRTVFSKMRCMLTIHSGPARSGSQSLSPAQPEMLCSTFQPCRPSFIPQNSSCSFLPQDLCICWKLSPWNPLSIPFNQVIPAHHPYLSINDTLKRGIPWPPLPHPQPAVANPFVTHSQRNMFPFLLMIALPLWSFTHFFNNLIVVWFPSSDSTRVGTGCVCSHYAFSTQCSAWNSVGSQ